MSLQASLTLASSVAVLGYIVGLWWGERQYRSGIIAGRERERREAKWARDRVVSDARLAMIDAGLKRISEKYHLEDEP